MAVASLVVLVGLSEAGCSRLVQLLPLASLLLWCGLAGLVEKASAWQRELYSMLEDRVCRD
jgi:hypothetical protein